MDKLIVHPTYEQLHRLTDRRGIHLTPCVWGQRTGKRVSHTDRRHGVAWVTLADGRRLVRLRRSDSFFRGPFSLAPGQTCPTATELVFAHPLIRKALHELSATAGAFGEPTAVLRRHPDRLAVIADWLADHGHPDERVRKLAAVFSPDPPPKRKSRGSFPRLAALPDPLTGCSAGPSLPLPPPGR